MRDRMENPTVFSQMFRSKNHTIAIGACLGPKHTTSDDPEHEVLHIEFRHADASQEFSANRRILTFGRGQMKSSSSPRLSAFLACLMTLFVFAERIMAQETGRVSGAPSHTGR